MTPLLTAFGDVLARLSPYLLLGFGIAGLLHAFVPSRWLATAMGGGGWRPVVAGAVVAGAAGPGDITGGATANDVAERDLPESVDVVSIYDSGPLDQATRDRAIDAANIAGASWRVVSTASSAMTRLSRGGETVQAAASSFSFPMSTTFLPDDAIATRARMTMAPRRKRRSSLPRIPSWNPAIHS